jgi:hypothetical protein
MNQMANHNSPSSQLDIAGLADRLVELTSCPSGEHSRSLIQKNLLGSTGDGERNRSRCSPVAQDSAEVELSSTLGTIQHLFAAVASLAGDVLDGGAASLESYVRRHLRETAGGRSTDPGDLASRRLDGEAARPADPKSSPQHANKKTRRKVQQVNLSAFGGGSGSEKDPSPAAPMESAALHHSTATSSTNLVDEFLDSMVLPVVARAALRGSIGIADAHADTNWVDSQHLPNYSEPEVDSPLLHQQKPARFVDDDHVQQAPPQQTAYPVPLQTTSDQQLASASTASTSGGTNALHVDSSAPPTHSHQRSSSKLPKPIPLGGGSTGGTVAPLTTALKVHHMPREPEEGARESTRVLYGLLLLNRAAAK